MKRLFQVTFVRFIFAGAANTLFGWAAFSIAIVAGLEAWAALIVGNVLGVGFNFLTFGGYAFHDLTLARLPRFIVAYLAIYGANLIGLNAMKPWIAETIWAQLVLTPPMALLSYVLLSQFVFRRERNRPSAWTKEERLRDT